MFGVYSLFSFLWKKVKDIDKLKKEMEDIKNKNKYD